MLNKIKTYCNKRRIKFFLANDIKLAQKLNLNGVYLPSYNKDITPNCFKIKKNFKLIGSAHDIYELNIKKKQRFEEVFISPVFKKKKRILGVHGFLKLKKHNRLKNIVLGGVSENNLKKLNLIKADGYAAISLFDKKKAPN